MPRYRFIIFIWCCRHQSKNAARGKLQFFLSYYITIFLLITQFASTYLFCDSRCNKTKMILCDIAYYCIYIVCVFLHWMEKKALWEIAIWLVQVILMFIIDVCSVHAIFVCQSEMDFRTHQFHLFNDFIDVCMCVWWGVWIVRLFVGVWSFYLVCCIKCLAKGFWHSVLEKITWSMEKG